MELIRGNGHGGVPLVGQNRTWRSVRMMPFQQVNPDQPWGIGGKLVKITFPHGLYVTVLEGIRSDGAPCQVTVPVPKPIFKDPTRLGMMLAQAWNHLHTFLNCACVEGRVCPQHQQIAEAIRAHEMGESPSPLVQ